MKEKSFEEALMELEQIVTSMESGSLPLEESIKKYEDGIKLSRFCKAKLEKAEKRIEILIKKEDGSVDFEEFEDKLKPDTDNDSQSSKSGKSEIFTEIKPKTNKNICSTTYKSVSEETDKKENDDKKKNIDHCDEDMLF